MFRCQVAPATEPTRAARAYEAAELVSRFLGDLCVVALASEDRRSFCSFSVASRDPRMTETMRRAVDSAERGRAAWPLAGRALLSGRPVVIDGIRPGELEGVVNPALDSYLAASGVSAVAFLPMRGAGGNAGVVGMCRGPGRPAYTPEEIEAAQRIADAAAQDAQPAGLLTSLLRDGGHGRPSSAERRFATLVERLPAIVYEAEPGP